MWLEKKIMIYKIYEDINEIKTKKTREYLKENKFIQRKKYNELQPYFLKYYELLKKYDVSKFVLLIWSNYLSKINYLDLNFSFLRNDIIRETMVFTKRKVIKKELHFLESKFSKKELKYYLEEEYVGNPIIFNNKYRTSGNTIHTLHHLALYKEKTKVNLKEVKSVIEWGGGYGNLARVFRKINPNITYTIIDLPLFSCIQWIYLSSIFGEDKINLITNENQGLKAGFINLLPICFLEGKPLFTDMFISICGLTESSKYAQEYVIKNNFFEARFKLLVYQEIINQDINCSAIIEYSNNNLNVFRNGFQKMNTSAFEKETGEREK